MAAARDLIHQDDERTLRTQVELTEIPAPPFGEEERGGRVAVLMEEAGLEDVRRDEVGNVIGDLNARGGTPALVLSAHLDTVFPGGTEVRVRREEDRWVGPGISDDGRGLAALIAIARVLEGTSVPLAGGVRFVATVGEEGAGDLRGAKRLFSESGQARGVPGFISLDGAGMGRIVTRGLGVRRLRVTVRGPGGHSWVDRKAPNPIHVLAAAVAEMDRLSLPGNPPASLTVALWGGGSSINAVPRQAWIELDLRSESGVHLEAVEEEVGRIVDRAVARTRASAKLGEGDVTTEITLIGDRPPGSTDPDHPLVQSAVGATRIVWGKPELIASSTDSNIPMALGIPAITMGAGGSAGKAHTPEEWFSNDGGPDGIVRGLLATVLFVGLE